MIDLQYAVAALDGKSVMIEKIDSFVSRALKYVVHSETIENAQEWYKYIRRETSQGGIHMILIGSIL